LQQWLYTAWTGRALQLTGASDKCGKLLRQLKPLHGAERRTGLCLRHHPVELGPCQRAGPHLCRPAYPAHDLEYSLRLQRWGDAGTDSDPDWDYHGYPDIESYRYSNTQRH